MPAPILTVDVEEWFHVCGHAGYADPATWSAREKRVHVCTDRILDLLAGTASKATFFVLGWVARQSQALVRRIAEAGHEIGCHGDTHRRVFELSLADFREEVRRSRDTLQEITAKPVTAFRAPEWSMLKADNPALAVLVEEGFRVDSSLTTAPPVGDRSNPARPAVLPTGAGPILEVPPLMGTFFGRPAMWGGGVCARLTTMSPIPGFAAIWSLRRASRARAASRPRSSTRSRRGFRRSSTRIRGSSTTRTRRCRASRRSSTSSTSRGGGGRKSAGGAG